MLKMLSNTSGDVSMKSTYCPLPALLTWTLRKTLSIELVNPKCFYGVYIISVLGALLKRRSKCLILQPYQYVDLSELLQSRSNQTLQVVLNGDVTTFDQYLKQHDVH